MNMARRTLSYIEYVPSPGEIYRDIINSPGWPYKRDREFYLKRDRAFVALLYLLGLRVSEALRLKREQFIFPGEEGGRPDAIVVRAIKLSKSRFRNKPRKVQYRDGYLPLRGERAPLTQLVVEYLKLVDSGRLFQFKTRQRAWQIVTAMTPYTCHWFRAFCEDYLYDRWNRDIMAVADYIKVDVRTLQEYIRKRYARYEVV